jgi:hypothetical protein
MISRLATLACVAIAVAIPAHAQSARDPLTMELTQSGGASTDDVAAAATQVRAFGELGQGIRYLAEGAWAGRSADRHDAFGTAYPYDNSLQVIEAWVERTFRPGTALFSVRGGRYRPPFGIYSSSDHAYIGFLRAPLVRYADYFALSNTFLEHGVDVVAGTPQLSIEAGLGAPADTGEARRRNGLDVVLRGQAFHGPFIAGISYLRTRPFQPAIFAHGRTEFGGVDVRYMRSGVQVRGEWVGGRPFAGTRTDGGYVDLIVHRPAMGPVTGLLRVEHLAYDAIPPFAFTSSRVTAGTRIRLLDTLALSVNVLRHASTEPGEGVRGALDVGVTYSLRRP